MKLLTSRIGRNISPNDKGTFKYELHAMTHWRLVFNITIKYKRNIDAQVMKWKMHCTAVNPTDTNHAPTEFSHQILIYLDTRATVMLICNNCLEQCLMNGWVGCVQNIVKHSPTRPRVSGALPDYVVVNSPKCLIWDDHNLFPDTTCAWAPIHMPKFQCDKYCCSARNIPLVV